MNIVEATRRYEAWLISNTFIHQRHLLHKHDLMREGVFAFLRATFYRWSQIWPEVCSDLRSAPTVLAVADLHVENFGTWRDGDDRLVWGVNDFDEAFPLPYTNDLVRLAASAMLAIAEKQLALTPKEASEAILAGYMKGLDTEGRPFILEEEHKNLRAMTLGSLRDPRRFWKKLLSQERVRGGVPKFVGQMFQDAMPERGLRYQLLSRVSGLGGLGRFRVVAVADWSGGKIAREVKALAPSACVWARNGTTKRILYQAVLENAVRARDPFVQVNEAWLIRRLSPHCCRIEMDELPKKRDEDRLLHVMGWETANIHLGSRNSIKNIRRDLAKRKASWLRDAAKAMVKATTRDWKEWKNS
jgi:Uncharacterized protein conserved in bacteria (DUF2252)